jgi:hypothetical protein
VLTNCFFMEEEVPNRKSRSSSTADASSSSSSISIASVAPPPPPPPTRSRSSTITSSVSGRFRSGTIESISRTRSGTIDVSKVNGPNKVKSTQQNHRVPLAHVPAVDRPLVELQNLAENTLKKVEDGVSRARSEIDARLLQARVALAPALDPLQRVALDPLQQLATLAIERGREYSEAEFKKAEQALRSRFGGYDDSQSAEKQRARKLQTFKALFDLIVSDKKSIRGGVIEPVVTIADLENLFGAANLFEARAEVGALSYAVDIKGYGSLNFGEFCDVLDKLEEMTEGKGDERSSASSRLINKDGANKVSFLFGTEGASLSMSEIVWQTLDNQKFSGCATLTAVFLSIAIIASCASFVLQSVPSLSGSNVFEPLEAVCLGVFTVEYFIRFYCSPDRKKLIRSMSHLIDILTIVPYYLELIYSKTGKELVGAGGTIMRVFHIFRVFRIFKLLKYVPFASLMSESAASSAAPIGMALFVMVIGMVLMAFGAYFTERGTWSNEKGFYEDEDGLKSKFQSIAESSYWAIVTLTGVGYGDLTPNSPFGKLVGALTALAGTVLVAFPVSIYTEEFSKEYASLMKSKALRGELGSDDLCGRLTKAHEKVIEVMALKHVQRETGLESCFSAAVPRTLAMIQQTYALKPRKPQSEEVRGMLHQFENRKSVKKPTSAQRQQCSKDSNDSDLFRTVWQFANTVAGTQAREAARLSSPSSPGSSSKKNSLGAGSGVIEAPSSLSPSSSLSSPPPSLASPSFSRLNTADAKLAINVLSSWGGTKTKWGKRSAKTAPGGSSRLSADSFSDHDLTDDSVLENAILTLLADKRRELWAQAQLLESRFRDDLTIEISRRWQSWMGMPKEYVKKVSESFIFNRPLLNKGLDFRRADLNIGIVRTVKPVNEMNTPMMPDIKSPSHPRPTAQSGSGVGGVALTEYEKSHSDLFAANTVATSAHATAAGVLKTQLKGLVTAPSAASAQAALVATQIAAHAAILDAKAKAQLALVEVKEKSKIAAAIVKEQVEQSVEKIQETAGLVRSTMADAVSFQPIAAPDNKDYHARMRDEFIDVLGHDAEIGSEGRIFSAQREIRVEERGQRALSSSSSSSRGKQTAADILNEAEIDDDEEFSLAEESRFRSTIASPTRGGSNGGASRSSSGSLVATSFGVSSLLPNMQSIRSSVGTGMASITGSMVGGDTTESISEYYSYFSRVSSEPIRTEDGDVAKFEVAPLEKVVEVVTEDESVLSGENVPDSVAESVVPGVSPELAGIDGDHLRVSPSRL